LVTIWLPEGLKGRFKAAAAAEGRTTSAIVRALLESWLAAHEVEAPRARQFIAGRRGLVLAWCHALSEVVVADASMEVTHHWK
jgi:plasmid stability protein